MRHAQNVDCFFDLMMGRQINTVFFSESIYCIIGNCHAQILSSEFIYYV